MIYRYRVTIPVIFSKYLDLRTVSVLCKWIEFRKVYVVYQSLGSKFFDLLKKRGETIRVTSRTKFYDKDYSNSGVLGQKAVATYARGTIGEPTVSFFDLEFVRVEVSDSGERQVISRYATATVEIYAKPVRVDAIEFLNNLSSSVTKRSTFQGWVEVYPVPEEKVSIEIDTKFAKYVRRIKEAISDFLEGDVINKERFLRPILLLDIDDLQSESVEKFAKDLQSSKKLILDVCVVDKKSDLLIFCEKESKVCDMISLSYLIASMLGVKPEEVSDLTSSAKTMPLFNLIKKTRSFPKTGLYLTLKKISLK